MTARPAGRREGFSAESFRAFLSVLFRFGNGAVSDAEQARRPEPVGIVKADVLFEAVFAFVRFESRHIAFGNEIAAEVEPGIVMVGVLPVFFREYGERIVEPGLYRLVVGGVFALVLFIAENEAQIFYPAVEGNGDAQVAGILFRGGVVAEEGQLHVDVADVFPAESLVSGGGEHAADHLSRDAVSVDGCGALIFRDAAEDDAVISCGGRRFRAAVHRRERLGIRDCSGDVQRHGTGLVLLFVRARFAVGYVFRPGDVQGSALPGHVLPGDGECVQIELEKSLQAEEPVARIVDVAAEYGVARGAERPDVYGERECREVRYDGDGILTGIADVDGYVRGTPRCGRLFHGRGPGMAETGEEIGNFLREFIEAVDSDVRGKLLFEYGLVDENVAVDARVRETSRFGVRQVQRGYAVGLRACVPDSRVL